MDLIGVLITLLILCLLFGLIWWVVGMIPLPAPFGLVVRVVVAIIFIIYLLSMLVGAAPLPLRIR